MNDTPSVQKLTSLLKALSDESRLRIFNLIVHGGELCVCDIERTLHFTQTKVSRHLTSLKHAGLVKDRRIGTWMLYSFSGGAIKQYSRFFKELEHVFNAHPMLQDDVTNLKKAIKNGNCSTYSTILPSLHMEQDSDSGNPKRK